MPPPAEVRVLAAGRPSLPLSGGMGQKLVSVCVTPNTLGVIAIGPHLAGVVRQPCVHSPHKSPPHKQRAILWALLLILLWVVWSRNQDQIR